MKWGQPISVPRTFNASLGMEAAITQWEKEWPYRHLMILLVGTFQKAPLNSHLGQHLDSRIWDTLGDFTMLGGSV